MEAQWTRLNMRRCGGAPVSSKTPTRVAAAQWGQVIESLQAPLDPGVRRANLLVSGIELPRSRNRVLQIGLAYFGAAAKPDLAA